MSRRLVLCCVLALLAVACVTGGASSSVRIEGGSTISVQSAPWAVFVAFVPGRGNIEFDCTGSVIDSTHVVTAGHCLFDNIGTRATPAQLLVVAGVSNSDGPTATDAEQDRQVASFRVHPLYSWSRNAVADDVSVLTLATPLDLSGGAVKAISLPAPNLPYPAGGAATINGFGQQDESAAASGDLRSIQSTIDERGECGDYTNSLAIGLANAVSFCPFTATGSPCDGDSGSGVVSTGGSPVLLGVIDGAPDKCPPGAHSISTYVDAPEILSFIQGNDNPPQAPRVPEERGAIALDWDPPLVAGNTLTCSNDGWTRAPDKLAYTFVDKATNQVLQSSSSGSFVLPQNSVGMQVFCRLSVSNAGGTAVLRTVATSKIKPSPYVTVKQLPTVTVKRGTYVTLHVILKAPRGLSGKFGACATLPPADGGRICHSTRETFGVAGQFVYDLKLKVKATARPGRARVAIAAAAGPSSATTTALLQITG